MYAKTGRHKKSTEYWGPVGTLMQRLFGRLIVVEVGVVGRQSLDSGELCGVCQANLTFIHRRWTTMKHFFYS